MWARLSRLIKLVRLAITRTSFQLPTESFVLDLGKFETPRTARNIMTLLDFGGCHPLFVRVRPERRSTIIVGALFWHPNVRLVWWTPSNVKCIRVKYDYAPGMEMPYGHFIAPFPMHPQLYSQYHELSRITEYRRFDRTKRILFAGRSSEGYRSHSGMLSRYEIIEHCKKGNLVTIAPTTKQGNWLALLASSDFFLAPPGVRIPFSHNLIEAMAVGTIPITNYGHWLTPPLIDGENCLAFDTLQDLDTVLGKAHSLSEAEVVEMRVRVLEYYDKHLSPEKLVERIQSCSAQTIWLHTLDGA